MNVKKSDTTSNRSSPKKSPSSSSKKNTGTRKTVRRRKTKRVTIDKSRASLLAGIIFLACCICIAFAVLSTPVKKNNAVSSINKAPATTLSKTVPAPQIQKNQGPKAAPAVPKSTAPAVSKKTEAAAKAPAVKNTSELPVLKTTEKADSSAKSQSKVQAAQKVQASSKVIVASAKGDTGGGSDINVPPPKAPAKAPFDIPAAKNGATLVIIIDDAGRNVSYTKKYAQLPFPLTIAVLPKLAYSKECAYVVRSNGKELILHQPMQAKNHQIDPGPGKISVDMSFAQIRAIVNENLAEIGPGVKGLNNHEGSEVTEDVLRIGAVLDTCLENGIYFLDSRTTANTQAPQAALERDMKIFEKAGPYLDNDVDRQSMLKRMYESLDFANKNGKAIIIGHVDKSVKILPALLEEMYPYLVKAGYKFATPSTLR